MKSFILFLLIFFIPFFIQGQPMERHHIDVSLIDGNNDSSKNIIYNLFKNGVKGKDTLQIADAYYLQGKYEMVVNVDYSAAYKYFLLSLNLYRKINYTEGISGAFMQLGVLHYANNSFDDAIKDLQESVKFSEQNLKRKGMSLYLMALSYSEIGKSKEAALNFNNALNNYEKIDYQQGIAECYVGIGKLYCNEGKYDKAILQFKKGEEYFIDLEAPYALSNIYMYIAEAYYLKKDFLNAEIYSALSRDNAIESQNKLRLLNAYNISWKVAESQDNPEAAFQFLKSYNELKDTIFSENNIKELAALKSKHEQEKKEQGLLLLQQKKEAEQKAILDKQKLQSRFLVLVAVLFLILALLMFNRYRLKKLANQLLENKNKIIEAEKRRAEFEKQNAEIARERALRSEKFKEQFLANMSHEIRTPMNAIMGMTGILLKNQPKEDQMKYLSAISRSSDNLLVILNDILDLSKLEAGKLEFEKIPFSIEEVMQNVHDLLRFKAEEKGIRLISEVDQDIKQNVIGDPSRLNQILINLAGNAIKFTDKGSVTVKAQLLKQNKDLAQIEFIVEDTGIGIEEDKLDHIFDSFTQAYSDTSRKYGGTGLGLTISKQLIELQGGKIQISSAKGVGSTFRIILEYELTGHQEQGKVQIANFPRLKDLKILLVEDNEFNVIVAEDAIKSEIAGVEIDKAENGRIAVEKVKIKKYDIILMDVQMPEMNGYDASQAIRALPVNHETPIIAMTANVMKSEVEKCFAAGMDEFISKPFNIDELIGKIHSILSSKANLINNSSNQKNLSVK